MTCILLIVFITSCGVDENKIEKIYYENGNLKELVEVNQSGKANGIGRLYYEAGGLHKITSYKNGRRHGTFFIFNKIGAIEGIQVYNNGKDSGTCYRFHPNGTIEQIFNMKAGKDDGMSYSYTQNQLLKFECYSVLDTTYYYSEYDSISGKLIDEYYSVDIKPDRQYIKDNGSCKFNYYLFGPEGKSVRVDFFLLNDDHDTLEKRTQMIVNNGTNYVEFGPLKKSNSYIVGSIAHLKTKIFKDTIRVSAVKFK